MSMAGQQAVDRFRQLERMHRAAQAESEAAREVWLEARQALQDAAIALERFTRGLPPGSVVPDAEGRAVRAVTKVQHVQVERLGQNVVDKVFSDHTERLPKLDAVTMPLHEARQAHGICCVEWRPVSG
jgi:hypothetical protein